MFAVGKIQLPHDLALEGQKLGFNVPCTSFQQHTVMSLLRINLFSECAVQTDQNKSSSSEL